MPRQTLTPVSLPGKWPTGLTSFTFTAADPTNKEQFAHSGRDILIIQNSSGTTAYTVTITSKADAVTGRTGDISAVSVPANGFRVLGPLASEGWRQTDGYVYLEAENAAIKFAVLRIA